MKRRWLACLSAIGLLAGCAEKSPPPIQPGDFSSTNAFVHVEKLVAFGSRPSGSAALQESAQYIVATLQESGLTVETQTFSAGTPRGPMQFHNIVAKTRRQGRGASNVIIFGAHYDTKSIEGIRFVGANDGGSGAGVLLEMVRVLAAQPNVWFVFFDGEECLEQYGVEDGLWGSKYFVEDLKGSGQLKSIQAFVLLDMVGDARLNITLPANNTGDLTKQLFDAARSLGFRDYFGVAGRDTLDDHVPFLQAGIPAIDIIDFEYGSAAGLNDYWHTEQDTLDKISPQSLQIVGQTAVKLLAMLRDQQKAH